MKTTSLLVLGLLATLLANIGAHSLANRFDPTSRAIQQSTAVADGDTLPCVSCDYMPS